MIGVKFNQSWHNKRKRINRLPKYAIGIVDLNTKGKAYDFIKLWQSNIRANALGVRRLKAKTVKAKQRLGYTRPDVPLYGLGDDDPHTFINMMRVFKIKDGYRVAPGRKRHHKSKLTLKELFNVHEYGCTISNGFGKGIRIRIPARSTFFLTYADYLSEISRRRSDRAVRKAIKDYLERGREDLSRRIRSKYARMRRYDEG